MKNKEIKEAIKKSQVCEWQVADVMSTSECAFSRKLRYGLTEKEKEQISEIIQDYKKGEKQ